MAKRLIIAEKPNVAKAIAEALSGTAMRQNADGIFEVGSDRIAACAGHILEQFSPDDYDEKYKKWSIDDLPIVPNPWKLKPIPSNRKRLAQIKKAIGGADVLINAGDNDAEGCLLVDEVIDYLGWAGPVQRLIISDINPGPIKKAMENLKDNKEFAHLTRKALARSRADWLLGMNCTRLYSTLGDQAGIRGVLSAGRVQSAVLGLVARRDLEIKHFKPHDYYTVKLEVAHEKGSFQATWKPHEEQEGLDSEKRLVEPSVVDQLGKLTPGPATIISADTAQKKQHAPLPFSLSELQKEANGRFGLTMAKVLEIAQALYDKWKLTTYPRTDTGYLPEDQHQAAGETLQAVRDNIPSLSENIESCDTSRKGKAFDDSKVEAHHGIVPTSNADSVAVGQLGADAQAIYQMICERFIAQFYPPAEYDATTIEVGAPDAGGERFVAKGKVWRVQGWRAVLKPRAEESGDSDQEEQSLPQLSAGDAAHAPTLHTERKKTTPPKPYNDRSLLSAMTGIHRHVSNKAVKKLLRESDGIGTEATRANIVDTLVSRKLLAREKKSIRATTTGIAHFSLMPADLTTPDMAAIFEYDTQRIEKGEMSPERLEEKVVKFVDLQLENKEVWLENARKYAPVEKPSEYVCRNCDSPLYEKTAVKNKKRLQYFQCKDQNCQCSFRSENGAPTLCFRGPLKESDAAEAEKKREEKLADAPQCGICQNPLLRRHKDIKGKKWHFWTCEAYQGRKGCETIYLDNNGEPGRLYVRQGEKVERQADGPECPECSQATFTSKTKAKQEPILICKGCDSMFSRLEDGAPGQAKRIRGEWVSAPGDGPQCPECNTRTVRKKTKKSKKPILICQGCDSMFWTRQNGNPLSAFKLRGELVEKR